MRYDLTVYSKENSEGGRLTINTIKSNTNVVIKTESNGFGLVVEISEVEAMLKKVQEFLKQRNEEPVAETQEQEMMEI